MNKYISILLSALIGLAIGGALFYWGYIVNGYIRMGLGLLAMLLSIKIAADNYRFLQELEAWIEKHQGSLILFYPCKKKIQEEIRAKFIPQIPYELLEVYYEGPKLVGDIKRSIVFELMKWEKRIEVNQPSILKIQDRSVLIEVMPELLNTDKEELDFSPLVSRIEKLIKRTS